MRHGHAEQEYTPVSSGWLAALGTKCDLTSRRNLPFHPHIVDVCTAGGKENEDTVVWIHVIYVHCILSLILFTPLLLPFTSSA